MEKSPSIIASIGRTSLKYLKLLSVLLTLMWLIVSCMIIFQLVEKQKSAFEAIVDSHQESIISGQYRIFLEGVSRAKDTFRNTEVCWGNQTINCDGIKSSHEFLTEMTLAVPIMVMHSEEPIAIVKTNISLRPVVYLSLIVLLSFIATFLLVWYCLKKLHQSEWRLRNQLGSEVLKVISQGEVTDTKNLPSEIRLMAETLLERINELQKINADRVKNEALGKMAAQVAHDIRSPLVALENVISAASTLPEDNRILVRMAINRIKDIANGLIEKFQEKNDPLKMEIMPVSSVLLSSAVESIVSEKRMQLRTKLGIEIEATINSETYGLFANVNLALLKRVLSNLCNNAIEAVNNLGKISFSFGSSDHQVWIKICDNGFGMAPEVLEKIMSQGGSHEKLNGMGLGLPHAKQTLAQWGGSLELSSILGSGTTVTLKLPKATPPKWFVSKITIRPHSTIVILDDDFTIHEVFRSRFKELNLQQHHIEIIHASTELEFQNIVTSLRDKQVLYLCDFELQGHENSGLQLIRKNAISKNSILVTSRFDEPIVSIEADDLGVRRIPKGLAHIIPIEVQKIESDCEYDAILIDDDILIHKFWNLSAKRNQKKLACFFRPSDFLKNCDQLNPKTPIYLDEELEDGVLGSEAAKDIWDNGFKEIFLATGHQANRFKNNLYLKNVQDKNPPWNIVT